MRDRFEKTAEYFAGEIGDSDYHREIMERLHGGRRLSYRELVFGESSTDEAAGDPEEGYQPREGWGDYHRAFCDLDRKALIGTRGVEARENGLRTVSSDDVDTAFAYLTDLGEDVYDKLLEDS